jgi:hypothetical protein
MPLKLNVGVTRKIGLPNYGSAGASCYLETDVDGSLIFADLSEFQAQVQQAFEACRRAVTDELANHRGAVLSQHHGSVSNGATSNGAENNGAEKNGAEKNGAEKNGAESSGAQGNGTDSNGHARSAPLLATDRQISYARNLASQIPGLGTEQLDAIASKMFSKPVVELTAAEASDLIDTLKERKPRHARFSDGFNDESI